MLKILAHLAWQRSLRRASLLITCLFACIMVAEASADDSGAPEYRIKAAMIFKFLSYTQWPAAAFEAPDSPYRIWVLGSSPISAELEGIIRGRLVNHRPVRLYEAESEREITRPHMVFVGHDAERYLSAMMKLSRRQPVLVVTEREEGLEGSSTINLRLMEGRIGFDVSLANAEETGLKLSSRLLSVATSVEREH